MGFERECKVITLLEIQQQGSPSVKSLRLHTSNNKHFGNHDNNVTKAGNLFNPSWVFNLNRTEQLENFCLKWDSVISVERFEARKERRMRVTSFLLY